MRKLLGALVFLLLPVFLRAQCTGSSPTWTTTPDESSVSTCVSKASAGDTINVTAGSGSVTWTSGVSVSGKSLSIIGPGASSLTINEHFSTGCGALFTFTPTTVGSLTRLSGFTLQPLSGDSAECPVVVAQGSCSLSGCTNLRIDNITFSGWAGVTRVGISYGIMAIGDFFGVLDHNTVNGITGNYLQLTEMSHASYQGVGLYGDNSWAQPEAYGSANFLFYEDNMFNDAGCCENEGGTFGLQNRGGSRVVVRHNTFNLDTINSAMTWHGTESGGRPRGGRTWEFYQNTVNYPSGAYGQATGAPRSGTGIFWGNTIDIPSSGGVNSTFNFSTYRAFGATGGWSACDGSDAVDTNDGGSTPTVYWSGTISAVNNSTGVITPSCSSSCAWTTNQWAPNGAPYSIHNVTQNNGGEIIASSANTLTTCTLSSGCGGGPGSWNANVGDSIQILRATACVDQAGGRGAGAMLKSSITNAASVTTPANEVPSPSYFWMNSFPTKTPGVVAGTWPPTIRVIRNRDFYLETINQAAQTGTTSPFDGTTSATGIGHGTLANRPATCTQGVGYWATDQGTFYICGASGWPGAPSYTPYTYPHPLTAGGGTAGSPLNPPTGLTATVQ